MYADIGPSPGEGLHCEALLCFQDDKIEYAEINREQTQSALIGLSAGIQVPHMCTTEFIGTRAIHMHVAL